MEILLEALEIFLFLFALIPVVMVAGAVSLKAGDHFLGMAWGCLTLPVFLVSWFVPSILVMNVLDNGLISEFVTNREYSDCFSDLQT